MNRTQKIALGVIALSVVAIAAVASIPKPAATPEQLAAAAAEDAKCRGDLQCWGQKQRVAASSACLTAIDRQAPKPQEWDDGAKMKLQYHRWLDQAAGKLTFYGDSLRIQNPAGGWAAVRFECDWDPASAKLLDLRLLPKKA